MGKILVLLAFATALLALASSEASAFLYSSFACQAVGARSVGWGRSFFIGEAKVIALSRCARRSGICTISLLAQATPECLREIGTVVSSQTDEEFIPGCCALAASGHAAAPPMTLMNARRFIRSPRRRGRAASAALRGRARWRS